MTRAKAADIAQALTNLGYPVTVIPSPDVNSGWKITVKTPDTAPVTAADVNSFAVSQSVNANVIYVEFS
jgi:hypothetical protein